ncbi:hypothetical protein AQUSIP_10320 [Aquicella siphonis]|uniref:Uncharacterized protein n=1 Tax=Aquicella siphonis TaxID=254247 RepID=A0A5E4PGU3_9COXI|nr:hypothetical protein [Aquicella siphonis]VVC75738.1 hypothetical protein AQUSIP_10320 [Aquicella siphonis]
MKPLQDTRQDELLHHLLQVGNAVNEKTRQESLKKIQQIVMKLQDETAIARMLLDKYYRSIENHSEREETVQHLKSKLHALKLLGDAINSKDCEHFLQALSESPYSRLKKHIEHTKYLAAAESYEAKTGTRLPKDTVETVNNHTQSDSRPLNPRASSSARPDPEPLNHDGKPPVFIDKKEYQNGSVSIIKGLTHQQMLALYEETLDELKRTHPNAKFDFKATEKSIRIEAKSEDFEIFTALHDRKMREKYGVFLYSTAKPHPLPSKYLDSQDQAAPALRQPTAAFS